MNVSVSVCTLGTLPFHPIIDPSLFHFQIDDEACPVARLFQR